VLGNLKLHGVFLSKLYIDTSFSTKKREDREDTKKSSLTRWSLRAMALTLIVRYENEIDGRRYTCAPTPNKIYIQESRHSKRVLQFIGWVLKLGYG
jgi:hypothetical protein